LEIDCLIDWCLTQVSCISGIIVVRTISQNQIDIYGNSGCLSWLQEPKERRIFVKCMDIESIPYSGGFGWLLFSAKWAIFQTYHGENKL